MGLKDTFKKYTVDFLRSRAMGAKYSPQIMSVLSTIAKFTAPEAVPYLSAAAVIARVSGPIEEKFLNRLADRIENGEDLNAVELFSEAFNDLKNDIEEIIPEVEKLNPEAADFLRKLFGYDRAPDKDQKPTQEMQQFRPALSIP